jgi:ribosomal protein S18 acetylase RimI-like enzyme
MSEIIRATSSAVVPVAKIGISIRVATMSDVPFMDSLQKQYNKQLGYFPTKQFEGYVEMGAVLVAVDGVGDAVGCGVGDPAYSGGTPLGYVISRDRYLKRDELGVIYQLCVAPGTQRKLVGASLVAEVFKRSAYGCKLYCCWCAQDIEANYFWESLGFVPIAFRAGSAKKSRVHIFWQRRIREGDVTTPWWFPSQTSSGAIREDRLVLPIPPGTSWRDVMPMVLPGERSSALAPPASREPIRRSGGGDDGAIEVLRKPKAERRKPKQEAPAPRRVQFGPPSMTPVVPVVEEKAPFDKAQGGETKSRRAGAKREKRKHDPKHLAAARELRDRWLEHVNANPAALAEAGKYEIARQLPAARDQQPHDAKLLEAA